MVYYTAANAIDGNNATAWVEGTPGKAKDWLQISFHETSTIVGLRIKNGYWVGERSLRKNDRAASIRVSFSDGSSESFTLPDPVESLPGILQTDGQGILFSHPHTTDWVKLEFLSVYDEGAEDDDLCIAEVVALADKRGTAHGN